MTRGDYVHPVVTWGLVITALIACTAVATPFLYMIYLATRSL